VIVVCLNGPPRCGKDTIGEMFRSMTDLKVEVLKFAEPVKMAAHATISLQTGDSMVKGMEAYNDCKDEPHVDFFSATPRSAYIAMSEDYCKKLFGDDVFGEAMVRRISRLDPRPDIVVITDCGFQEEVDVLNTAYDCKIVEITREGCDFENDSRGFLIDPDFTIQNNTAPGRLRGEVAKILAELEEEING